MRYYCCFFIALFFWCTAFGQTIQYSGSVTFCEGGNIKLTATSGTTFQWTKDGSNISEETSSSYTANASGTYNVVVDGNPTATPVVVTVNPKPIIDFTTDNNNVCSGTSIQFIATVAGNAPFIYSWGFGDGNTSTLQNPAHTFTSFGCGTINFNVTLTVTDANGCSTSIPKQVSIKQTPDIDLKDINNPFSQFNNCTHSPSSSNPNFSVQLDFNSPAPSCVSAYTVDWGDGTIQNALTATSFPLTHVYAQLGSFDLTVTATSTNGCSYSKVYKVVNQSNPAVGIAAPGSTTGCAPAGFWFKLKGYEVNSPGTTYTWDFGDGSAPVVMTTPVLVDSIFHLFASSSCTQSGQQFIVKVTATNGCKSTNATVDNITVYAKPKAGFAAPSSACVNNAVPFNNTTVGAYNQGTCDRTTLYSWNFGDPSSAQNTSTAISPSHSYSTAGTYTITLIAEGSCGKDTMSKTICITNATSAAFTLDNATGCSPLTVNITNNSTGTSNCTTPTYAWTITYSPTNCGTTPVVFNYVNGTGSSSFSPSLQLVSPGIYTIKLTVTNACGTASISQTVNVKRSPTPLIDPISTQCGIVNITPSATVPNCGGTTPAIYLWSFPGGSPASSTSLTPGTVSYSTFGNNTIQLAATNECGTIIATQTFAINPIPTLSVPANLVLCAGQSTGDIIFTSSAGASVNWNRSGSNIGLSPSASSGNILSFTTVNTGTTPLSNIFSVSATAANCTTSTSFSITVNPTSTAPGVIPLLKYCVGDVASPLTATPAGSNTLNWYTTPSGGTPTTAPVPNTASAGSTIYYVSQTNAYGCEGPRALIGIAVSDAPIISATFNNPSICGTANGAIIISGLAANTLYTVKYSKNGAALTFVNLTSNGSGVITVSGLTAATYSNVAVTLGACTSNIVGPLTLIDPNPPAAPTASGNSPVCSGGTLNLIASGGPAGASYAWTGPNFSSTSQNPVIGNVPVTASGTYYVTIKVNGCTSPATPVDVLINPTPVVSISSNTPVCSGSTLNLTATATGVNSITYSWTGPNNFTSVQQNPVITNAGTNATGTYSVIATSSQGNCSATATKVVTINPTPNITVAGTDPASCSIANGILSISGLTPNTLYTVQYSKNGGPLITINSSFSGSGVINITGLTAGVYSNITVTLNGCQSNIAGPITLSNPNPPATPTIASNSPLCSGGTLSFTANTIPGATYLWSGPNNFTSTLQNPVITNAGTNASGTYILTMTVNGCASLPASQNAVVNPTPLPSFITSSSPVCAGGTLSLTASTTAPGITYAWVGPNSFTSNTQNIIITNMTSAQAGVYTLTAFAGTCPSPLSSTLVVVNPLPKIASFTYKNPSACFPSSGNIVLSGLQANTTYTVQYSKNGFVIIVQSTSDNLGQIIISNLSTGAYSNISVSLNGCISNIVGPLTLEITDAPAAPLIFSNSPLCAGKDLQLSASSTLPGVTFQWTGPNSFASNVQNPVIANATTLASGTYYVSINTNGCTSVAAAITVTVNALPIVTAEPDFNLCRGQSLQLNALGAQTYQWSPINDLSCNNCANPIASPSATITYIVEGKTAGCSAFDTMSITVTQPFKISASNNDSICAGSSVNLLATGAPLYLWSPSQGLNNITIPNPVATPILTTNYTVLGYDQFNCFTDTAHVLIAVGKTPTVNLGPDLLLPTGTLQPLNSTITNGPVSKWLWSPATNLSCNNCALPIATIKNDISYTVVVSNNYGCSASDTINIKITCDQTQVFIPNAFTPDGDGVNDILMVRGKGIAMVKYFRIFNRWGEMIFEKTNFQPNDPTYAWDGKIKGIVGPPDVFVYTVEVICENGYSFTHQGNVSIIK